MNQLSDSLSYLVIEAMLGTFIILVVFIAILYIVRLKAWQQQKKHDRQKLIYQANLLKTVNDTQESERKRIGQNLHDDIGAALATLRLKADFLLSAAIAEHRIEDVRSYLKQTIDNISANVREISHQLTPEALTFYTLSEAVEQQFTDIANFGLRIVYMEEELRTLDEFSINDAVTIYRILEELIQNTLKHAKARQIDFTVEKTDIIKIIYQDDGNGMPQTRERTEGMGIRNIKTRIEMLRGSYDIQSPAAGFRIILFIPY